MIAAVAQFLEPEGQGLAQILAVLVAFALSSLIGLERQLRGKSAGLRTQTIVGTASALFLLVSKYGFQNVLGDDVVLDPSRVAAQVVSGIGFLGAGLIITRGGSIHGLTTAASVWETAAVGMAAGAGLPVLAVLVTALHFVVVFSYTWVSRRLPASKRQTAQFRVVYLGRQGVLRELLSQCSSHGWKLLELSTGTLGPAAEIPGHPPADGSDEAAVSVTLTLEGPEVTTAADTFADTAGVLHVRLTNDAGE